MVSAANNTMNLWFCAASSPSGLTLNLSYSVWRSDLPESTAVVYSFPQQVYPGGSIPVCSTEHRRMTAASRTGYRASQKVLHWLTVLALAAQLAIGYVMDADDSGRGRGRGRGGDSGRGRGGDSSGYLNDPEALVRVHVALGVTILVLAVARVAWRRVVGLPPWAEQLTPGQRGLATWTERALLSTLFVIPLSGLARVTSTTAATSVATTSRGARATPSTSG